MSIKLLTRADAPDGLHTRAEVSKPASTVGKVLSKWPSQDACAYTRRYGFLLPARAAVFLHKPGAAAAWLPLSQITSKPIWSLSYILSKSGPFPDFET